MSEQQEKYPYAEIGERLKAIRLSLELSIKDYVALLGIPYTRYVNWETGARRPKPDEAEMFCERFTVTMDFIYRGKLDALPSSILKALSSMSRDNATSKSSDNPLSSAAEIK